MNEAEIEPQYNRQIRRAMKFIGQKSQGKEKTHNKGKVPSSSNHTPNKTGTNHERMLERKKIRMGIKK